jgi:hypothetical protein
MKFRQSGSELFLPDGASPEEALRRCTHMAIGAHPDDVELIGYSGIAQCFGRAREWFVGVGGRDFTPTLRGG